MRTYQRSRKNPGFTLTELLVVIAIIGILVTFVIVAAADSINTANARDTQSLIAKLEIGVNDRLEALNRVRSDIGPAHRYLSNTYYSGTNPPLASRARAQVIAQYDLIRSEFPEVFFTQDNSGTANYLDISTQGTSNIDPMYPLNFGGVPYTAGTPLTSANTGSSNPFPPAQYAPYVLPMANALLNDPINSSSYGAGNIVRPTGSGIFGASYAAAAGIYKNLGYLPDGYDGADNNGNGMVDEWTEGVGPNNQAAVIQNVMNHRHKTARAEMLYAVLVEGRGPLGSVFRREDFTARQVQDTDHDGLPEFVDGWGNPIQFYLWPVHFPSDVQKGGAPYAIQNFGGIQASPEQRERDPMDPNNQLVGPAWWSSTFNSSAPFTPLGGSAAISGSASFFETMFHSITDPNPPAQAGAGLWNRSANVGTINFVSRRAYLSKFLIVSGGPDGEPGVAQFGRDTGNLFPNSSNSLPAPSGVTSSAYFNLIENAAAPYSPYRLDASLLTFQSDAISQQLQVWGADDVVNQDVSASTGGGTR